MSLDASCCDIQIVASEFGGKQHETMDPSHLVSMVQAGGGGGGGGVMVWGIFS